jgi:A/G-specific adenine glycosylase
MYDAKWKSNFRRKLLNWFDGHQRELPWRQHKTPYRIWISEIMLQQTQVATVIDYFNRFTQRFPNVATLAQADQAEVLKLWEGLGYYRRARQMHAAAQVIVENHNGKFPTDFESVLALPGIGRYTAGAILSIALDQKLPILEGNTIRLFARLMTMQSDPRTTDNQKALWEFSQSLLPRKRCGDFNQALMELGSQICNPKRPKCLVCPINNLCPTAVKGLQEHIPVASKKVKYEDLLEAAIVVNQEDRILVRQCGPGERWESLWDFPRYTLDQNTLTQNTSNQNVDAKSHAQQLSLRLKEETGLAAELSGPLFQMKHAVTRYRITLQCWKGDEVTGRLKKTKTPTRWLTLSEIEQMPMSVTGRKIAHKLKSL